MDKLFKMHNIERRKLFSLAGLVVWRLLDNTANISFRLFVFIVIKNGLKISF